MCKYLLTCVNIYGLKKNKYSKTKDYLFLYFTFLSL